MIDPAIWPLETRTDGRGHLRIGGVDVVGLADRLGTPLYLYDAATIRDAYRRYGAAFKALRPVRVSYAIKACGLRGVAAVLAAAGADASAASLGELLAAKRAGFKRLLTESEDRNEPMRRLNEKLGYVPAPDWSMVVMQGPVTPQT